MPNSLDRYYTEFNIADVFEQTFGIRPPANYKIEPRNIHPVPDNSSPYKIDPAPPQFVTTFKGSILFRDDEHNREYYLPVQLGGLWLPFPVISITTGKTIVETQMVERKGSVHEIISTDDIVITIRGIIIRPDNNFPEEELEQLNSLFVKNESLAIRNALTDIFLYDGDEKATDKVLIKSLSFPEVIGRNGMRPYQMQLVSDLVLTLEVVE